MGFKPQRKTYELVNFPDYPGLEVVLHGTTVGELNRLTNMDRPKIGAVDSLEQVEAFRFLADRLVRWNIEHPGTLGETCEVCDLKEDEPVPPTLKGLSCIPFEMITAILMAWMTAMVRLPLAQSGNSSNGAPNIPEFTTEMLQQLSDAKMPNRAVSLLPNSFSE